MFVALHYMPAQTLRPLYTCEKYMSSKDDMLLYVCAVLGGQPSADQQYNAPLAFITVQAVDIARWLQGNVQVADNVIVHMDLGTGREFQILQELLTSVSLNLVDHIEIRWHYQAQVT